MGEAMLALVLADHWLQEPVRPGVGPGCGLVCWSSTPWRLLPCRRRSSPSIPRVMLGKPVVAGTRVTVELILEKLAAGELRRSRSRGRTRTCQRGPSRRRWPTPRRCSATRSSSRSRGARRETLGRRERGRSRGRPAPRRRARRTPPAIVLGVTHMTADPSEHPDHLYAKLRQSFSLARAARGVAQDAERRVRRLAAAAGDRARRDRPSVADGLLPGVRLPQLGATPVATDFTAPCLAAARNLLDFDADAGRVSTSEESSGRAVRGSVGRST